jgi:methane monooxygenase PmoA-like
MRTNLLSCGFVCLVLMPGILHAGEPPGAVKLVPLADRVRVEIGGQLFTEYVFKGAKRPYCYPVLATDGTSLVRDFPMKETAGEDVDHPHHRSLWFAHSNVNGIDFWNEGTAGTRFPKGSIEHDALMETKSGEVGVLRTRNRWVAPDGKLICTDERTLRFHGNADVRMIDYEVTLQALPETAVVMGDNKDGTMAIRLAQWLTMPHKIQQKDIPGVGHIVTAKGERDAAAWGTRADWCDYFAERNGRTYGVAIFDHPQNLRHPTWWMARDYGLFGANPFGQHDFEPKANHPAGKGDYTIPAAGSLTLRYRFCFHTGDEKAARIAERYADYIAGK